MFPKIQFLHALTPKHFTIFSTESTLVCHRFLFIQFRSSWFRILWRMCWIMAGWMEWCTMYLG